MLDKFGDVLKNCIKKQVNFNNSFRLNNMMMVLETKVYSTPSLLGGLKLINRGFKNVATRFLFNRKPDLYKSRPTRLSYQCHLAYTYSTSRYLSSHHLERNP